MIVRVGSSPISCCHLQFGVLLMDFLEKVCFLMPAFTAFSCPGRCPLICLHYHQSNPPFAKSHLPQSWAKAENLKSPIRVMRARKSCLTSKFHPWLATIPPSQSSALEGMPTSTALGVIPGSPDRIFHCMLLYPSPSDGTCPLSVCSLQWVTPKCPCPEHKSEKKVHLMQRPVAEAVARNLGPGISLGLKS